MTAPHPAAAAALRELAESDERLRPTHDHLLVTVERVRRVRRSVRGGGSTHSFTA